MSARQELTTLLIVVLIDTNNTESSKQKSFQFQYIASHKRAWSLQMQHFFISYFYLLGILISLLNTFCRTFFFTISRAPFFLFLFQGSLFLVSILSHQNPNLLIIETLCCVFSSTICSLPLGTISVHLLGILIC